MIEITRAKMAEHGICMGCNHGRIGLYGRSVIDKEAWVNIMTVHREGLRAGSIEVRFCDTCLESLSGQLLVHLHSVIKGETL